MVCGMVTTVELGGTKIDDVGAGRVVSGGGTVVAVVVCTGGVVVAGAAVPVLRGAVVTTGGEVVAEVPDEPGAVAGLPSGVDVDDVEDVDDVDDEVVVAPFDVVVGRWVVEGATVKEGAWVATCCLGDVSPPVATSNRRPARAMVARAYSPTLKR